MTKLPIFACRHQANSLALRNAAFGGRAEEILGAEAFAEAKREITVWPGYAPTPLLPISGLASALGLGAVHYKDEGQRFGLKSFKALGGAYAVLKVLRRELATRNIHIGGVTELLSADHQSVTSGITVCCATDGNHGRSVAWAAQMFGCRCVVYLHEGVSEGRANEIAAYGAQIRRVAGSYDDSVGVAANEAREQGWFVVSDTSWEGYEEVPAWVMQGYMVMAEEIAGQWPGGLESHGSGPSHLFIQGGVGGLAAGVAGQFWRLLGAARPRTVVVEPDPPIAAPPTVIRITQERQSRAVAFLPFGVAQFEQDRVGWGAFFATSQGLAALANIGAYSAYLAIYNGGDRAAQEALFITTIASGAAWIGLTIWGIIDGNVAYEPTLEVVSEIVPASSLPSAELKLLRPTDPSLPGSPRLAADPTLPSEPQAP